MGDVSMPLIIRSDDDGASCCDWDDGCVELELDSCD